MIKHPCISLVLLLVCIASCESTDDQAKHSDERMNQLAHESSPYLLQHAKNPVDWYPWNDEALARAQEEDKMIIVSVGYAACHWCHVMEHESFEDSTVAALMNEHFISIKVDREERPDIDNIYMTACQLSSQRGCGWPLNAFALPDGRPVWAGTYFPKDQWLRILQNFIDEKANNRDQLEEYAAQLTQGIQSTENLVKVSSASALDPDQIRRWNLEMYELIDFRRGGRKGAPKFAMPGMFEYLLEQNQYAQDPKALEAVEALTDNMASGGIYDQVGGAFARYSVDSQWMVPHFEKMLYDNGQLLSLYAHAYQLNGNKDYLRIIDQTIGFMQDEWMHESGGFYSSYDADSEGEEGKYYVWSYEELENHIPQEHFDAFVDYYNIRKTGNWEGHNILHADQPLDQIAKKHGFTATDLRSAFDGSLKSLKELRTSRVKPGLDEKILSSWNGLAITGLVDAYRATQKSEYLELAKRCAAFVRKDMIKKDHSLYRNHKDGKSVINGFLDDYANIIRAWIQLYQVTYDKNWLDEGNLMMQYCIDNFVDEETDMFYYTDKNNPELIARKYEVMDNVIPGSNSVMAHNLYDLGTYLDLQEYKDQARQMLDNVMPELSQSTFFYNWCRLYLRLLHPVFEVAVVGPEAEQMTRDLQRNYQGDVLFLGSKAEGELSLLEGKYQEGMTMIYVCQNKVCKLPVDNVEAASEVLKAERQRRTL